MNVWSPYIDVPSEFSLSQMWLLAGSFNSDLNSIEAGWQVCCLFTQFLVGPYPQDLISLILHIYSGSNFVLFRNLQITKIM